MMKPVEGSAGLDGLQVLPSFSLRGSLVKDWNSGGMRGGAEGQSEDGHGFDFTVPTSALVCDYKMAPHPGSPGLLGDGIGGPLI